MTGSIVRRIVLALSLIMLTVVWARNLLLFLPSFSSARGGDVAVTGGAASSSEVETTSTLPIQHFRYEPAGRDPFQMPKKKETTMPIASVPVQQSMPLEAPHASLRGIVWNASAPQAVVYDSVKGRSCILTMQQWINGYQLVGIDRTKVTLRSKKHKVVWESNE